MNQWDKINNPHSYLCPSICPVQSKHRDSQPTQWVPTIPKLAVPQSASPTSIFREGGGKALLLIGKRESSVWFERIHICHQEATAMSDSELEVLESMRKGLFWNSFLSWPHAALASSPLVWRMLVVILWDSRAAANASTCKMKYKKFMYNREQTESRDEDYSWKCEGYGMVMNKPPFCKGVDNQILLLDWRVWGSHDDHVPIHEVALQVLLHVLLDHWLQLPIKYNRKGSICITFHVFSLYVSPTEKEGENKFISSNSAFTNQESGELKQTGRHSIIHKLNNNNHNYYYK